MTTVAAATAYAYMQKSNSWPLLLIFVAPIAVGYLGLTGLLCWLTSLVRRRWFPHGSGSAS
jgi:hypothetical protein